VPGLPELAKREVRTPFLEANGHFSGSDGAWLTAPAKVCPNRDQPKFWAAIQGNWRNFRQKEPGRSAPPGQGLED
jgi:hypothetical protein